MFVYVLLINLLVCLNVFVRTNSTNLVRKENGSLAVYEKYDSKNGSQSNVPLRRWVSELYGEAEENFEIISENVDCKRDAHLYKLHLQNNSVWARRMKEASQWPNREIVAGLQDHMGNFQECLNIRSHGVRGQYCFVQSEYEFSQELLSQWTHESPDDESAWKYIQTLTFDPVRISRKEQNWAVCIPSTCGYNDLNNTLNRLLRPIFQNDGLTINVKVNPIMCSIADEIVQYPTGYYVLGSFIIIIFMIVIIATLYDLQTRNKISEKDEDVNYQTKLLRAFSLTSNCKKLVKASPNKKYGILQLHKFLSMLVIIYGHRLMYALSFPLSNTEFVEELFYTNTMELVTTHVADMFFFISGFLVTHFGYNSMKSGGLIYLALSIVCRWLRMIPVYTLVILFIIYMFPYINDGPLWKYRVFKEVENCKASFWANVFAVSNIFENEHQCMLFSWYIPVDFQSAIIVNILLYILTKNRKMGLFATALTVVVCAAVTINIIFKNHYHGFLQLYMSFLEEPRNSDEFNYFYNATYARINPFIMGFLVAFTIQWLDEINYKIPVKAKIIGITITAMLFLTPQLYGAQMFRKLGKNYDPLENAIYHFAHRIVFLALPAFAICSYFNSGVGIFNSFYEWRAWFPLGRLSYSAFIGNMLVIVYQVVSHKTTLTPSRTNQIWYFTADILITYLVGFVLYIFFDCPLQNILHLFQTILLKKFVKRSGQDGIEKGSGTETIPDQIKDRSAKEYYENRGFGNDSENRNAFTSSESTKC